MNNLIETLKEWLFDPTVGKLVLALVGLLAIYIITRLVRRSLTSYVKDSSTRYHTRKFVGLMGYIAAVVFVALVFSDKLGGLTIAFGVAGAGIAFALQEIIASCAGWLAVSFGNYYKPGDRVMLAGIRGDVVDISVLRTTLFEIGDWVKGDQYNGRVVRVANSFVFKEPVYNYSGDFPFLWDEITVPIRHGSDRALARQFLLRAAEETLGDFPERANRTWEELRSKYLIEAASVESQVSMVMDENWISFTLRYVTDYKRRRSTKSALYEHILTSIDDSEGRVDVASAGQEITLVQGES